MKQDLKSRIVNWHSDSDKVYITNTARVKLAHAEATADSLITLYYEDSDEGFYINAHAGLIDITAIFKIKYKNTKQ